MAENENKPSTATLRAYVMFGVLALIWAYFHWSTDSIFLTPRNLANLMTQMSVTGILAIGMLMVIVSANIDLSVGSVLGFSGAVAAYSLSVLDVGLVPSIALSILIGMSIGFLHGTLTAYFNIPAFIVTLGGLLVWRGGVKWLLGGNTVPIADESFKAIGQSNLSATAGWILAALALAGLVAIGFRAVRSARKHSAEGVSLSAVALKLAFPASAIVIFIAVMNSYQGVPVPVLIFLGVALVGVFLTTQTTFGRYLYAIGGNAEAARLSGINNRLSIVKVFTILGAFTGIAALIFTARVGSSAPDAGTLKELDAIAACVIGGASLMGGRGTVIGACIGALIMASLDNGMSLLNVRDFMQDIIKGSILVAAVGLDMYGRRHA
ncbi:MAG: sugar ABC transporter permease [Blastocatellia bacterium]|nr:sugar ABC transporter permease [Blastocatellia bacterium]